MRRLTAIISVGTRRRLQGDILLIVPIGFYDKFFLGISDRNDFFRLPAFSEEVACVPFAVLIVILAESQLILAGWEQLGPEYSSVAKRKGVLYGISLYELQNRV